jgi:chemotaxis protein CheD
MHMNDRHHCVFGPGYFAVSDQPAMLCTVCGAGLAVTVWDRARRKGAMVHAVLAATPKGTMPSNFHLSVALKNALERMQAKERHIFLNAQLFGAGFAEADSKDKNTALIMTARRTLAKCGVKIISEDVGGSSGRKIMFDTHTGDAMVMKTRNVRKSDWQPQFLIDIEKHGRPPKGFKR